MIWSKVKQIKDNWPTAAAFGLLLLGVFYILAINSTPEYPYTPGSAIIYPLVIFANRTAGILALILSILFIPLSLVIITERGKSQSTLGDFGLLMIVSLFLAVAFWALLQLSTLNLFAMATLFALPLLYVSIARFQSDNHLGRLLVILGMAVIGYLFTCLASTIWVFGNSMQHKDSLLFEQYRYNLAEVTEGDFDCTPTRYVLYQCDRFGVICQLHSDLNGRACYQPVTDLNVSLKVDQVENAMYIVIDGEQNLVP